MSNINNSCFRIEIIKNESTSFDRSNAIVIYYQITNLSDEKIDVEISNKTFIDKDGLQIAGIYDLCHCRFNEGKIFKSCKSVGTSVFKNINKVENGCKFSCTIAVDKTKYECLFEFKNNKWEMIDFYESNDEPLDIRSKEEKLLKDNTEIISAMIEKFNAQIMSFNYKFINDSQIKLFIEVCSKNGGKLKNDFYLKINFYNEKGEMIETEDRLFTKDDFDGYDTTYVYCDNEVKSKKSHIKKVRIFATLS